MIHLLDTDTFILLLRGTAITRAKTQRQEVVKRAAAKILATCKKTRVRRPSDRTIGHHPRGT